MPLTALCFLAGSLSIAAMPPFNGFVSEWLALQTLLRSAELSSVLSKSCSRLCGAELEPDRGAGGHVLCQSYSR